MSDLSRFPVTHRWKPAHADRLQLYSAPTPNGVKVSIALEEMKLPYEAHRIDLAKGESRLGAFTSLNPNGRIPAILDPEGPGGEPIAIWESGAILVYLAEKSGQLLPRDPAGRYRALQWVFFQVSGIGPTFGQLGWFHRFDGRVIEDERPRERFTREARRLLGVLDGSLSRQQWLASDDDYSIADISLVGWVRALTTTYDLVDVLGLNAFGNVQAWLDRCLARPAVARGLSIPASQGPAPDSAAPHRPAPDRRPSEPWPRGH